MNKSNYPSLYQINTRVWLTEISSRLGYQATLDDIPDYELDKLTRYGFDWIWLMSVWQTGKAGQQVSRTNPVWRKGFQETLPDLKEEDIGGSGFAILSYNVHEALGGNLALAKLRERFRSRGIKLMLDFIPNHTGLDHKWVSTNPEYYVQGSERDLLHEPDNYIKINSIRSDLIFAYGRDPFFTGWPDTLQLNYGNPNLQKAMIHELMGISEMCDGVRCDMAMLLLPDIFRETWGIDCNPFWPEAIRKIKASKSDFCFMAEVYWGKEWILQQQGFDYTYDKTLIDRLKKGIARPVREHFLADMDYQNNMARFLENHDEHRIAAELPVEMHEAAAVITYLSPGLRFFHQGQLEGKTKHVSPHLIRVPKESANERVVFFYKKLFSILSKPVFRVGHWQLLECITAWEGNLSQDNYISFAWISDTNERIIISINYSPHRSQCYVRLPFNDLNSYRWHFEDLLSGQCYMRDGTELESKGLYLDEPAWNIYIFTLKQALT